MREQAIAEAAQGTLFSLGDPKEPLEPVPFNFHFLVRYADESEPRRLKLVDWEINKRDVSGGISTTILRSEFTTSGSTRFAGKTETLDSLLGTAPDSPNNSYC